MGGIKAKAPSQRRKYVMANLVYGQNYPTLWIRNQLKSLCDDSNFGEARRMGYDLEYVLFTDEETLAAVAREPQFMQLTSLCNVVPIKMNWQPDADRFGSRYSLLVRMFHETLKSVLNEPAGSVAAMSVWVADLVFAKQSIPRMLSRLEQGHDAVFMVPIRSAADSVTRFLDNIKGAPSDLELFELAYNHLHPLWTHSTWNNPYFTRMPYSMLWNSGTGLLAHNFGITPIVFKPIPELSGVQGVIDADVPKFFKKPFWATDWIDAPVAGVEPLSNGHYPNWRHASSDIDEIAKWSMIGTQECQIDMLKHPLYYPSKKRFNNTLIADTAKLCMKDLEQHCSTGRTVERLRAEAPPTPPEVKP